MSKPAKVSGECIRALPKTDLHVHLDGSLRLGTLIELAKEQKIELPSYDEEGLKDLVFKENYADLPEYLAGFSYTTAVLQDPESLERTSYEMALDCFADGVFYVEVRLAPQRHMGPHQSMDEVMRAVSSGFARAKGEINARPEIKAGSMPEFEYGIIACAMRKFEASYSRYYRQLFDLHPQLPEKQRFQIAAFDLVRGVIRLRDEEGLPVVGFDLAGEESGYPAADFAEAYDLAHKAFLKKTVHAGEAYGPPSIFQAITECHADRIGHGTNLFREDMVDLPTDGERKRYVRALWQYIADRRITVEVCLTSNMQTMPNLKSMGEHPFRRMIEARISTTFGTDNRLISRTTSSNEIGLAIKHFGLSERRLRNIIIYGFKRSFFAGDYLQKRAYVRRIIDYYDEVCSHYA
jgi:adenosine deaminase